MSTTPLALEGEACNEKQGLHTVTGLLKYCSPISAGGLRGEAARDSQVGVSGWSAPPRNCRGGSGGNSVRPVRLYISCLYSTLRDRKTLS